MPGRIVRLPSEKEAKKAEAANVNARWPAIGRYFEAKGKTYLTLNHIPDVVFLLQEDKKQEQEDF